MTPLGAALRKKFKTPADAVRALGLDEALLMPLVGDTQKGNEMAKRRNAASPAALVRAIAAMDESGLAKLIDALEDKDEAADALTESGDNPDEVAEFKNSGTIPAHSAATDPGMMGREATDEGDKFDEIRKFLTGKLTDEDMAQLDELMGAIAEAGVRHEEEEAESAAPEALAPKVEEQATDEDEEDEEKKKDEDDMVTKPAMDAAIAAAVAAERRRQKEIRDAEEAVRPVVGKLVAQDSAESVYRAAFKKLNKDVSKVHASALPVLFSELAVVKGKPVNSNAVAMDAGAREEYAKLFPHASRLKI